MTNIIKKKYFITFIFLFIKLHIFSLEHLDGRFWIELEPMQDPITATNRLSYDENTLIHTLLTEVQFVFSGMIYGYNFKYTPMDKKRHISDFFQLTPQGTIQFGDKNLKIIRTKITDGRLFMDVRYFLSREQQDRFANAQSNTLKNTSGTGFVHYFRSSEQKIESIQEAIKQAIRNSAREYFFNKPRNIQGYVFLSTVPYTIIQSAKMVSQTQIRYHLQSVIPYSHF